MLTIIKQVKVKDNLYLASIFGLSTDSKPTGYVNGSTFYELDTSNLYMLSGEDNTWVKQQSVITNVNQIIEIGSQGQTTPSADLANGGIFLEMQ